MFQTTLNLVLITIREGYEKAETLTNKKISFLGKEVKSLYEHIT